jgi:hypothetical protein
MHGARDAASTRLCGCAEACRVYVAVWPCPRRAAAPPYYTGIGQGKDARSSCDSSDPPMRLCRNMQGLCRMPAPCSRSPLVHGH